MLISSSSEWQALVAHSASENLHLPTLLTAPDQQTRLTKMSASVGESIHVDFSREQMTPATLELLEALAKKANLTEKIEAMFRGDKINATENRAVLHVALRNPAMRPEVAEVHNRIRAFSGAVRNGDIRGAPGKKFTSFVCVGIGGSYLGPEFVYEALRGSVSTVAEGVCKCGSKCQCGPTCECATSSNFQLRFLANIDPADVTRALHGLDLSTTMVIIISKTFTTAETMMNATTLKKIFVDALGSEAAANQHFCAVSTALDKTKAFGIPEERVFGFWDWVGGRFSVTSAVGLLPLSLVFGWDVVQQFLDGAKAMDDHFLAEKNVWKNLPASLGLIAVWNSAFKNYAATAVLPYSQALVRFVAHVQQVDMESIGKRVTLEGESVDFQTGPIVFGEPGTNGQHSFYQLLHQGSRVVPAEFIGFANPTMPLSPAWVRSHHDELMSNFFAQPDALALGKEDTQNPAKHFPGNRPSLSLLLGVCDAWHVGTLLALYEHRTAVQAFIYGVNAFDQFGVELGKVLAKEVRGVLAGDKAVDTQKVEGTREMIKKYLQMKQ
jgi:glucose-6-phosphate isomerase